MSSRNRGIALHNVLTPLSAGQVREAEAAFTRLGGRYVLGDAIDYFLRHFAQPDQPVSLNVARDSFLEARTVDGVRPRSLLQLRSTVSQFIAFITLRFLPAELQPEIERARLKIETGLAASLNEIIRRLTPPFRKAARKAARDANDIQSFLCMRLDPALREIVAATRDQIDKMRRATDREIAAEIIASVPGANVPAVHEIATSDVEAFLQALRAKGGTAMASRKTWNNARGDLHAFFGWCTDKQRRWCAENPATAVSKYKLGRGVPQVLTVAQARELMNFAATYKSGVMAKYFALALFAGLRTGPDGELLKLTYPRNAQSSSTLPGV